MVTSDDFTAMNRIGYLTIAVMSAVIALSGCADEVQPVTDGPRKVTITSITASAGEQEVESRTVLDGETLTSSWLAGDAINVFFGASESSRFVCQEAGDVAQFKGSIDVVTGGGEGLDDETSLWGVYPYSDQTTCDGTGVTYTLPAVQEAKADTFADDLFPTLARSRNFYLSFYNVCGSFRFTVANADIVKVTLRGAAGEMIAGQARITMDTEPVVSEILDGETELVMTAPGGGCFEVGKDYYFAVYPTDFQSGIVLTYYKAESKAEYVYETAYSLKRNRFARFRDKDAGLTFEPITLNDWEDGENVKDEI